LCGQKSLDNSFLKNIIRKIDYKKLTIFIKRQKDKLIFYKDKNKKNGRGIFNQVN